MVTTVTVPTGTVMVIAVRAIMVITVRAIMVTTVTVPTVAAAVPVKITVRASLNRRLRTRVWLRS